MSSNTTNPHLALGGMFESGDKSPFGDATIVYVPYCTSDGWAGDASPSEATFGLSFRGARVVAAVVNALVQTEGMGSSSSAGSTRLLLAGCSAGSRGAMFNLDYIPGILEAAGVKNVEVRLSPAGCAPARGCRPEAPPPGEKRGGWAAVVGPAIIFASVWVITKVTPLRAPQVRGLLDSPLWIDYPVYNSIIEPLAWQTQQIFPLINSSRLGAGCAAAFPSAADQWRGPLARTLSGAQRQPKPLPAAARGMHQGGRGAGCNPEPAGSACLGSTACPCSPRRTC